LQESLAWYGITMDLPPDECVKPQILNPNRRGYYSTAFEGRPRQVHVMAWKLKSGHWPGRGEVVRHMCHNGAQGCCNPHHLEVGTQAENVADWMKFVRSLLPPVR